MFTRREAALALVAGLAAPSAYAGAHAALPFGGRVSLPAGYAPVARTDRRNRGVSEVLIAYRRHFWTPSYECDGMIAVARADSFGNLETFAQSAAPALTRSWAKAYLIPGYLNDHGEAYPFVSSVGPLGQEVIRQLSVHVLGYWNVYDRPAHLLATNDQGVLMIGVWILDSDGGLKRARKIASGIARSYRP